ncbi:MAG: penicillin acylase family protein, partial [Ardenticatenaceae bacterium]
VAATIAHYLFHQVRHQLVSDELAVWTAKWEGKTNQPMIQNLLPHAFNSWAWVLDRLDDPDHPWWTLEGTPRREGRDEILILALQQTIRRLEEHWGDDPTYWMWGRVHRRTLEHPLGGIPVIGRAFNRGPFPLSGGPFSPNADLGTVHYYQTLPAIGASARLIADLSDWDRYLISIPGGNSGHPASPHYADGLTEWRDGRLTPLPWSRGAVDRSARGRLFLVAA